MKLSLAWIFDHIKSDWKKVDVAQLIKKFNTMTAEIEHFYNVELDVSPLSVGVVTKVDSQITVFSAEWDKEFKFEKRPNAHLGHMFLITKKGWATIKDLKGEKEGLFPAVTMSDKDAEGGWKDVIETEDVILEIDNKSITHRPDMWAHRGFAREIAALLDLEMMPLEHFVTKHEAKHYEEQAAATKEHPFGIEIKAKAACTYYAGLYVKEVSSSASPLFLAQRLVKIDARPINGVVDITNYVMFDIGQPMHAFDADKIPSKKIEVNYANPSQKLVLLDGQTPELIKEDVVITDGKNPIALAGIMGGQSAAVTLETDSLFLEAACFNSSHIRKTSARLKLRTEASARFEKALDPQWTTMALERFIKLAHDFSVSMKISGPITTVGHLPQAQVIEIEHSVIESMLGVSLKPADVKKYLENIDYKVVEKKSGKNITYSITVPTFRTTKEPVIKEDVIEEIGRFYGFDRIPHVSPALVLKPKDLHPLMQMRAVKNHLAYSLDMHEINTYAFYDEEFLHHLAWKPEDVLSLKNPVSEHYKHLVTSLVPGLLKAVMINQARQDDLAFFEYARVWHNRNGKVTENKALAGIFYDRKKELDFFEMKYLVSSLFAMMPMDVEWQKIERVRAAWYDPSASAQLVHNKTIIGYAGLVDRQFMHRVVEGNGFAFELNGDIVSSYKPETLQFKPLSKYPEVWLDISILIPVQATVDKVTGAIQGVDKRITSVRLIDFFEKQEWAGQRSLTFRYYIQDPTHTLIKDEIDAISHMVAQAVKKLGATIR